MNATLYIGGRVVVVVDPSLTKERGDSNREIVAAAFWHPPNCRIELYHVVMLLRCGALRVLANWGLNGFLVSLSSSSHHLSFVIDKVSKLEEARIRRRRSDPREDP